LSLSSKSPVKKDPGVADSAARLQAGDLSVRQRAASQAVIGHFALKQIAQTGPFQKVSPFVRERIAQSAQLKGADPHLQAIGHFVHAANSGPGMLLARPRVAGRGTGQ
jgi:hypothetical protein